MNYEWLTKTFQVNLFGHIMLTQQLLPLIKKSKNLSKIVNISARVGSIGDNKLGGMNIIIISIIIIIVIFMIIIIITTKKVGIVIV